MNVEDACNPPHHILGVMIRSRTRIYVSYILPNSLELLIYITQIAADCAVSYQHFKSHQTDFGWATLSFILIPPVTTCLLVLSSKSQWIKPKQSGSRMKFVCMQLLQMVLFPLFVIFHSAKLVFWSIEALFHDDDDDMRMECLRKAKECSTCELYHLIQAYGQSAPQIILQLYHMLTQDLFRNFQTTSVQAISLIFSIINVAATTATYQRFESQKQVGRQYAWSTEEQLQKCDFKLKKNIFFQEEYTRKKHDSESIINRFPESDKIMENFKARNQDNITIRERSENNIDVTAAESLNHALQLHDFEELSTEDRDEQTTLLATHLTDDDKIKSKPQENAQWVESFDIVPNSPAPLPPTTFTFDGDNEVSNRPELGTQTSKAGSNEPTNRVSKVFSQLDNFKDMLFMNAQLYIKDSVPRPPKILIKRLEDSKTPPTLPKDTVDFFLPRPAKVVKGIQQDDFAARTIAFFGWIAFIFMRMLSLSAFCVFYPKAFAITITLHYLLMLAFLCLESRFKVTLSRTLFYFLLAYIYIYVLLEFRIKFKHVRIWLVGYLLLSMTENIVMSMLWHARGEFDSWWFNFIFDGITYSAILFVATTIVYYFILKPADVIFLVQDNDEDESKEEENNRTNPTATTTSEV